MLEPASAKDMGLSARHMNRARTMVHEHVASGRTPSCVAIVARHGQIVLEEVAGVRRAGGPALEVDDIFPIASITKPMVAAVLMSLVEEGRVGINDPAALYLPELNDRNDNSDVLIHHLLTHTAGWEMDIGSQTVVDLILSGGFDDPASRDDFYVELMMTMAVHGPKLARAGEVMCYSNPGYECLAEIIRRVTGGTLDEALGSRLFEPLGMKNSSVIGSEELGRQRVLRPPHSPFGTDAFVSVDSAAWRQSDNGFGGMDASARDLAVFAQMILNGGHYGGVRLLAPTTVRSMCTNQIPGVPADFGDQRIKEASWGYGFTVVGTQRFAYFVGALVPPGTVVHPGAGGAAFWIDFENDIVGVVFEAVTEMSDLNEPISGLTHRFQDVVTAAVQP